MKLVLQSALLLLFLHSSFYSVAQSKKGLKLLKKKQYDKAWVAFEKDLQHPIKKIPALYGMAKITTSKAKDFEDNTKAIRLIQKAQSAYNLLERKKLRKLKKYKLRKSTLNQIQRKIQKESLVMLQDSQSYRITRHLLNSFLTNAQAIRSRMAKHTQGNY